MATGRIGKGGSGRCGRTSGGGGGSEGFAFTSAHPRLILTPTKLTALTARKTAVTAEYLTLKNDVVDAYFPTSNAQTTLTSALGAGGAGTTFTVTDGSVFPTISTTYRCGLEVIQATRSGNTMTVVTRAGASFHWGAVTDVASHASGDTIYQSVATSKPVNLPAATALLHLMGVAGYDTKAKNMLNYMMVEMAAKGSQNPGIPVYRDSLDSLGRLRNEMWFVILGYDWMYNSLSASEIAIYSEVLRDCAQFHVDNPYGGTRGMWSGEGATQNQFEANITANKPGGQVRSVLAIAATIFGDQASAQTIWDTEYADVTSYHIPSIVDGPVAGGAMGEGTGYGQESWTQIPNVAEIIDSATSLSIWAETDPFIEKLADCLIHTTLPGSRYSATTTTGTVGAGSRTMTVTNIEDFVVGDAIAFLLDPILGVYNSVITHIADISGLTVTLADVVPSSSTAVRVSHRSVLIAYGDTQEYGNFEDSTFAYIGQIGIYQLMDRLQTSNPTLAGYLRYWWGQHVAEMEFPRDYNWHKFLYYDPSLSGIDYTGTLSKAYTSSYPDAWGLVAARNSWNDSTATHVYFMPGGEIVEHVHAEMNGFGIFRKGVKLISENTGYVGVAAHSSTYWTGLGVPFEDWSYGARYHNTVVMNGHGHSNVWLGGSPFDGPASMTRSSASDTYTYARGDASLVYSRRSVAATWPAVDSDYPNNDAQTYVRDFMYWPDADVVVIHDRLGYANATTSPTEWGFIFTDTCTLSTATVTMARAGQSIQQDILLPASAVITKIDQTTEDSKLRGNRIKVVSGVSASAEYGLSVFQLGDSGFTPVTPSLLTTTNANIVQFGTRVCGCTRGSSVTLNISYNVSGTPLNRLMGFAPSTAYHVTRGGGGGNTITIAASTGSGDTTSSTAGILEFTL